MPTVPVKAAGWRIEPPVSLAVAARQSLAATAAAEPPDEPPGTSNPRLSPISAARAFSRSANHPSKKGDGPLTGRLGASGEEVLL